MSIIIGDDIVIPFAINETDLLAGTSAELVSPVDGFVKEIATVVQKAVTTGGSVKAAIGTTDVTGASVTVANAAVKGSTLSAKATGSQDNRKVAKGGRIQVIPAAAFDVAGAVSGYVTISTGS